MILLFNRIKYQLNFYYNNNAMYIQLEYKIQNSELFI